VSSTSPDELKSEILRGFERDGGLKSEDEASAQEMGEVISERIWVCFWVMGRRYEPFAIASCSVLVLERQGRWGWPGQAKDK
jgi:hypothetical protein